MNLTPAYIHIYPLDYVSIAFNDTNVCYYDCRREREKSLSRILSSKRKFGKNAHPMTPAAAADDDVLYLSLTVDNKTSPSTRLSMCGSHAENKHH